MGRNLLAKAVSQVRMKRYKPEPVKNWHEVRADSHLPRELCPFDNRGTEGKVG